jgi:cation-transporting ATPase 13A1
MLADFAGSWLVEILCKHLLADLEPKRLVTRGRERREARRAEEVRRLAEEKRFQEEKEEAERQAAAANAIAELESRKNR